MALASGVRLGPYEIADRIGQGGMGHVYRARDSRIDRTVAIKVLPSDFAGHPDRRARFTREAKSIAALNHPNICTLYEFDSHEGTEFLVMEYLSGESLEARLSRGAIPIRESLGYAIQIADALDCAHQAGIVHRDLKPSNVMLTASGLKLLDFGLAKLVPTGLGDSGDRTAQHSLTAQGAVMGTPRYMTPEQVRGEAVDPRTDIFQFGVVLFEMLTGRKAFDASDLPGLLSSIVEREVPPLSSFLTDAPLSLEHLIQTCLEKNPEKRWRSAGDLVHQLEWISRSLDRLAPQGVSGGTGAGTSGMLRFPMLVIAFLVGGLVGALGLWNSFEAEEPSPEPLRRYRLHRPSNDRLYVRTDVNIAITPDGSKVLYNEGTGSGSRRVWVRDLAGLDSFILTGEEIRPRQLFVSPDGEWVGFLDGQTPLMKMSINGGPAVPIVEPPGPSLRGASWADDGNIFFSTRSPQTGLFRVNADGTGLELLTTPDLSNGELDHYWPDPLPGGRAVVFTIRTTDSLQEAKIALLTLEDRRIRILAEPGFGPRYVRSGHIVYAVGDTLRAFGFDLATLRVTSEPIPVLSGVAMGLRGGANFGISQDGTLAYITGGSQVERGGYQLAWVDRKGNQERVPPPPELDLYSSPSLSPDGSQVAFGLSDENGRSDIYLYDLASRGLRQLTFSPASDARPIWSPEGERIIFTSNRNGPSNLFWKAVDGTGAAVQLTDSPREEGPRSVVGDSLIFSSEGDLYTLDLGGGESPAPLFQTDYQEDSAALSPDGRWLAYVSDQSGAREVYVAPFPDVKQGRWKVSNNGGTGPVWSADGTELLYRSESLQAVMHVAVKGGTRFEYSTPEILFAGGVGWGSAVSISPTGDRFLIMRSLEGRDAPVPENEIVIVTNWFDELRRLVPR